MRAALVPARSTGCGSAFAAAISPGGDTAVNGMLQGAWRGGVRSFWMVGTGDLRPSLMELNLTGALWCTPDTDCAAQRTAYLRCTYRAPDG